MRHDTSPTYQVQERVRLVYDLLQMSKLVGGKYLTYLDLKHANRNIPNTGTSITYSMKRFADTYGFAALLNILTPGLGHLYRRDFLFGAFIFLIIQLAAILFFVSLLISLPLLALGFIFTLPALFFVISFIDLERTVRKKKKTLPSKAAIWLLLLAVLLQFVSPTAPVNFFIRNAPTIQTATAEPGAPGVNEGDLLVINPAAYRVNIVFMPSSLIYDFPRPVQNVAFNSDNSRHTGMILGLSGDEVQIVDGYLAINDTAIALPESISNASLSLTFVPPDFIMIGLFEQGDLVDTKFVFVTDILGKAHRVW